MNIDCELSSYNIEEFSDLYKTDNHFSNNGVAIEVLNYGHNGVPNGHNNFTTDQHANTFQHVYIDPSTYYADYHNNYQGYSGNMNYVEIGNSSMIQSVNYQAHVHGPQMMENSNLHNWHQGSCSKTIVTGDMRNEIAMDVVDCQPLMFSEFINYFNDDLFCSSPFCDRHWKMSHENDINSKAAVNIEPQLVEYIGRMKREDAASSGDLSVIIDLCIKTEQAHVGEYGLNAETPGSSGTVYEAAAATRFTCSDQRRAITVFACEYTQPLITFPRVVIIS